MRRAVRVIVLASAFAAPTVSAFAQEAANTGRFKLGPLGFTPFIAVTNVGVDNNVFNEGDNPKRDTIAAVGPGVNLWTHLGRARLSGNTAGQYLYFKTYDNQRSWNTTNGARVDLPLARLTPFVSGAYVHSNARAGYEIDARAGRLDRRVTTGTSIRLSGKTAFEMSGTRAGSAYDRQDPAYGAALSDALDRTSDNELLRMNYTLTPLTTFVLDMSATQDRFRFDPTRNADSITVLPGFTMKPLALISGSAFVGIRQFNALRDSQPDYVGVVALVDVKYELSTTRIGALVNRDVNFSLNTQTPIYVSTDIGLTVTQRITRAWEIVGRGGHQWLGYRSMAGGGNGGPIGTDRNRQFGAGLGYRLGGRARLGVDANYYQRRAVVQQQGSYDGLRVGASVTYGLPQ